jgi:hypothetical protein
MVLFRASHVLAVAGLTLICGCSSRPAPAGDAAQLDNQSSSPPEVKILSVWELAGYQPPRETNTIALDEAHETAASEPSPQPAKLKGDVVVPVRGPSADADEIDAVEVVVARRPDWDEAERIISSMQSKIASDIKANRLLHELYSDLERPAFTQSHSLEQHIERLEAIRRERPESAIAIVALAGAYVSYAWEARGSGYADTVTPEGWKLFHARIAKAHELLDEALELGVKDTRAYFLLVTVTKAKSLPNQVARMWVTEGKKVTLLDDRLYCAMADYLQVKWLGEPGDLERFANEVVEDIPGEDKFDVFGHIVASGNCSDFGMLLWGGFDQANVAGAARVFMKRYGDSLIHTNFAALFAWVADDQQLAKQAKARLKDKLDPAVFGTENRIAWFRYYADASKLPRGEMKRTFGSLNSPRGMVFAVDSRHLWMTSSHHRYPVHSIDTETGYATVRLSAEGMGAYRLSLSDDGSRIVAPCVADETTAAIVVWDSKTGKRLQMFAIDAPSLSALIAPDGRRLAFNVNDLVYVVDWKTSGVLYRFQASDEYVNSLVFSPDSRRLAVWARQEVAVFDLESGEKKFGLPTYDAEPQPDIGLSEPHQFDSDGRLICDALRKKNDDPPQSVTVRIGTDGSTVEELIDQGFLALSADATLGANFASGTTAGWSIDVWDIAAMKKVNSFGGHRQQVYNLRFSPDKKLLASAAVDGEIKLWNLTETGSEEQNQPGAE